VGCDRQGAVDVFATELARIGPQHFAVASAKKTLVTAGATRIGTFDAFELQPRSDVITVAFQIFADGKSRTVDEVLAEAVARDLLPRDERKKYVYATLEAYVEKMIARG